MKLLLLCGLTVALDCPSDPKYQGQRSVRKTILDSASSEIKFESKDELEKTIQDQKKINRLIDSDFDLSKYQCTEGEDAFYVTVPYFALALGDAVENASWNRIMYSAMEMIVRLLRKAPDWAIDISKSHTLVLDFKTGQVFITGKEVLESRGLFCGDDSLVIAYSVCYLYLLKMLFQNFDSNSGPKVKLNQKFKEITKDQNEKFKLDSGFNSDHFYSYIDNVADAIEEIMGTMQPPIAHYGNRAGIIRQSDPKSKQKSQSGVTLLKTNLLETGMVKLTSYHFGSGKYELHYIPKVPTGVNYMVVFICLQGQNCVDVTELNNKEFVSSPPMYGSFYNPVFKVEIIPRENNRVMFVYCNLVLESEISLPQQTTATISVDYKLENYFGVCKIDKNGFYILKKAGTSNTNYSIKKATKSVLAKEHMFVPFFYTTINGYFEEAATDQSCFSFKADFRIVSNAIDEYYNSADVVRDII